MTTSYTTKNEWAISENYASWAAFQSANPDALIESTLDDMLEEATEIINENIGCFNSNITDTRFLSRIKKLNNRMVTRMRQVKLGQGVANQIPLFSPNDFLIKRERRYLKSTIGITLGYRSLGEVGI